MENITNASDFVQNSLGKKTIVKLTNEELYKGTLISIDGAFNLYLINSSSVTEDNKELRKYNHLFIRGNNVLYIAPFINDK
jgi:small nuclear ribonucleoprotein (snRNP)-like protein